MKEKMEIPHVGYFDNLRTRAKHVAMIKHDARLQYAMNFPENFYHTQMASRKLKSDGIKARVIVGQYVHISDFCIDGKAGFCNDALSLFYHFCASIYGEYGDIWVVFEKVARNFVCSGADVKHGSTFPKFNASCKSITPERHDTERGDGVSLVIIFWDIRKDLGDEVSPNRSKLLLALRVPFH